MKKTYRINEVFQEIKGDDNHLLLNIPKDVAEQAGWKPGDQLTVKTIDGVIKITKAKNG